MSRKGKTFRSDSDKLQSKAYVSRNSYSKNKLIKMKRTERLQPNNEQVKKSILLIEKEGAKYTRNRKSAGHICKGCSNANGFIDNQPTEKMLKGKAPIHKYVG